MKKTTFLGPLLITFSGLLVSTPHAHAQSGLALTLDGVNDYAKATETVFPNSTTLRSFTVEAWIYPTQAGIQWIADDDCYDLKLYYAAGAANGGLLRLVVP